ncbi:P-type conjugative transfer protein TrbG [Yersinia enterocolitica]|nr:P-type conjugative transfer protein TrbG [Yersinia enterocolitica]EME2526575.1 P-type conjugative transfer protein TrbG [Yersinia enterocolitica]
MKKIIISILALSILATHSYSVLADDLADQYFSKETRQLTPQEKAAIAIGEKWQTGNATSKPVAAADGSIRFIFGSGQIQILCAVLQVCDIALQPGEQVNSINAGDPRFIVEPAITGSGASEQLHLIVKPLDVGLDTSLVVGTDRRTYHFRLRSSRKEFMPLVSFTYPEDAQAKWAAIQAREKKEKTDNTIPQTGEYLGNLNFNYDISGSARWKPTRVYNDGTKTIIEMSSEMRQSEAPTLLVVRKNGGVFSDPETVMVNYRVQGNRYIVDTIFDKAILVVGVGSSQDRVTITRGK